MWWSKRVDDRANLLVARPVEEGVDEGLGRVAAVEFGEALVLRVDVASSSTLP
jgi:hypothetical protein